MTSLERILDIQNGLYAFQKTSAHILASRDIPFDPGPRDPSRKSDEQDTDADALFSGLLSEWLQFYGPVAANKIAEKLGVETNRLQLALDDLRESDVLITGPLVEETSREQVCDAKPLSCRARKQL